MYNFCPQHWPHASANEMTLTESDVMFGHKLAIPTVPEKQSRGMQKAYRLHPFAILILNLYSNISANLYQA